MIELNEKEHVQLVTIKLAKLFMELLFIVDDSLLTFSFVTVMIFLCCQ